VLDLVRRLTENGRRPELTLARMAEMIGRPASSIADALGRLRALGLIGVAARMGRTGGHRFWRVAAPARRTLDGGRHRQAVARIVARFWRDDDGSDANGHAPDTSSPRDEPAPVRDDRPADRPSQSPAGPHESFGEIMRRNGIGAWIDEKRHGRPDGDR